MRRQLTAAMAIGMAWAASLAAAEPADALGQQVQQLALEVMTLKLELCRISLRQISAEAAPLQRELQWVRTRLARLTSDDQTAADRVAAVEQQWMEGGLSPEARREMQQFESKRSAAEAARTTAEREKLQSREREISTFLDTQLRAWNSISSAASVLETELRHAPRAPEPAHR